MLAVRAILMGRNFGWIRAGMSLEKQKNGTNELWNNVYDDECYVDVMISVCSQR